MKHKSPRSHAQRTFCATLAVLVSEEKGEVVLPCDSRTRLASAKILKGFMKSTVNSGKENLAVMSEGFSVGFIFKMYLALIVLIF